MNIFEFKAIILKNDTMNAAFIEFPFDAFSCFGKNGQIKIYIEINGFKYRSSLVKMGYKCHIVGIKKEYRVASGVNFGDTVNVRIWEDKDERLVEIPKLLEDYFNDDTELFEFYKSMSFTHRNEITEFINSAKKDETKIRRCEKIISTLMNMRDEKLKKNM